MGAQDDYVSKLKNELAQEQAFRAAVVEEFRESIQNEKEFTPEDMKKRFYALLPMAFERLTHLINNAESEAVQFSAAKYVFSIATGQIKVTADNDPDAKLTELLSSLVTNTEATNNT